MWQYFPRRLADPATASRVDDEELVEDYNAEDDFQSTTRFEKDDDRFDAYDYDY